MARLINQGGCLSTQLSTAWRCLTMPARPGGSALPPDAAGEWIPASVPGTVATARRAARRSDDAGDLHALDHWYRLDTALPGGAWLDFAGLATFAEIWIDGTLVATSDTMFVPLAVTLPPQGGHRLDICFRALRPALRKRSPGRRARWRGRLTTEEGLREHRTTLLGHMPGWSGDTPVIGPYRPITLHQPVPGAPLLTHADLRARLTPDGAGIISLRLKGVGLDTHPATMTVGDRSTPLHLNGDVLEAEILLADPPRWWPHTHGTPATVAVTTDIGGCAVDLGRAGFRTIQTRDPGHGFGLTVNGTPVFCRGAIWTGLDASALPPDSTALATTLHRARKAGLNMLRVVGMTVYETPEFFELCDELGIMVWHDFMFTRFDYPDTAEFTTIARTEARTFLHRVQLHPSLAVVCGGSEIVQAAAMSGCPPETWYIPLFEETLAQEAAAICPDACYVPHSPWSANQASLPVAPSASIAHYFGVGAYQLPLQDLSSAGICFAAECLAFANLPEPASPRLADRAGSKLPAARDLGVEWDFADVRDHYMQVLFGVSAAAERRRSPATWLELGRATTAFIMQQAIAAWRTDGRCAGALVLMLHDLVPGAGWGTIGSDGRPKSAWYALSSVCQPVQVLLRDLGQNGVMLHAINETQTARRVTLALRGLAPDGAVEPLGHTVLELEARETRVIAATELLGRWRDLTNAWQFGPPAFAVLGATLDDAETGARLSDATHFPSGPALPRTQPRLSAHLTTDADPATLAVSTQGFAQFVQIDDDGCIPAESYFHLWPGETRVVALHYPPHRRDRPTGTVSALNAYTPVHYGVAA